MTWATCRRSCLVSHRCVVVTSCLVLLPRARDPTCVSLAVSVACCADLPIHAAAQEAQTDAGG